jgi:hypothetical protein
MIIRFGYCPPNPGPKAKINCRWYSNIKDAIDNYNNQTIWIKKNSKYVEITFDELIKLI